MFLTVFFCFFLSTEIESGTSKLPTQLFTSGVVGGGIGGKVQGFFVFFCQWKLSLNDAIVHKQFRNTLGRLR